MRSKGTFIAVLAGVAAGIASSLTISWLGRPSEAGVAVRSPGGLVRAGNPEQTNTGKGPGTALRREANVVDSIKEHEEKLRAHDAEPIDEKWASATRRALETNFTERAAACRYELVNIDCRQTSCVATLRWSSYAEAQKNNRCLIENPIKVICGVDVFIPPPTNPSAQYDAKIVLDQFN